MADLNILHLFVWAMAGIILVLVLLAKRSKHQPGVHDNPQTFIWYDGGCGHHSGSAHGGAGGVGGDGAAGGDGCGGE
jgi:hypothetical protein